MTHHISQGTNLGGFNNFVRGHVENFATENGAGGEYSGFAFFCFRHTNNIEDGLGI
jgi:hypothetical protein